MQHPTLQVPNVSGAVLRDHLHAVFQTFPTLNSGVNAPPATYPFMLWADTTTGLLKIRNAANSAWVVVGELDAPHLGLPTLGANTFTGPQDFAGNVMQRAKLLDYSETVNELGLLRGGQVNTIDCRLGNVARNSGILLGAGTTSIAFANPPPAGVAFSLTLLLRNGGHSPNFAPINWPAGTKWPGGDAPTLTVSGYDILTFITIDGGASWFGSALLDMQ